MIATKKFHNGGSAWEVKVLVKDERDADEQTAQMLVVLPDGHGLAEIDNALAKWFSAAFRYRIFSAVQIADGFGDEKGLTQLLVASENITVGGR